MPCHDERNEPRYQPGSAGMSEAEAERLKERLKLATQAACAAGRLLHRTNMLKHLPQRELNWMVQHAINDFEKGDPWLSIADINPTRKHNGPQKED